MVYFGPFSLWGGRGGVALHSFGHLFFGSRGGGTLLSSLLLAVLSVCLERSGGSGVLGQGADSVFLGPIFLSFSFIC